MEGNYCEVNVKKPTTGKDIALKVGLIAGMIFGVILMLRFGGAYFLLITVACGVLAFIFFPRTKADYEYVYCDGQLDFDIIYNGEKRKHLNRLDMDQVAVVAPKNSHALDGYRRDGVKVLDFSGAGTESNVWGAVVTAGEQTTLFYFEPTQELITKMKQKSPRKIVEY